MERGLATRSVSHRSSEARKVPWWPIMRRQAGSSVIHRSCQRATPPHVMLGVRSGASTGGRSLTGPARLRGRRLAGPWGTVESEWNLRRVSCVVRVWGATEGRGVSDESLELDLFTSRPKGERDAEFADFMAKSMGALHRTAFLLCGDADRADELTQHALERTYRAWPRVRQGDPLSYARRVL